MFIQADQTHICQASVPSCRELQQALHTAPMSSVETIFLSAGIMIYNYNNNNSVIKIHSQAQAHRHKVWSETRAGSVTPSLFIYISFLFSYFLQMGVADGHYGLDWVPLYKHTHTAAYLANWSGATRKHRGIIPASYQFGFLLTSASMKP